MTLLAGRLCRAVKIYPHIIKDKVLIKEGIYCQSIMINREAKSKSWHFGKTKKMLKFKDEMDNSHTHRKLGKYTTTGLPRNSIGVGRTTHLEILVSSGIDPNQPVDLAKCCHWRCVINGILHSLNRAVSTANQC